MHSITPSTPPTTASEVVELARSHAILRGGDTTAYIDIDPHGSVSLVIYRGADQYTLALQRGDWGSATAGDCPACKAAGKDPEKQHADRSVVRKSSSRVKP